MPKLIDLSGQKFGKLTVIVRITNVNSKQIKWLCDCDCGQTTTVQRGNLKNGHTQSCGCLRKEKGIVNNTQHGHYKNGQQPITYSSWAKVIQRCANSNNKDYHNYGGRGITMCKRWLKFENFLEDMGEPPAGKSIDRIDNNKGYYKSNCRWATRKQQNRNKRNNRLITFNGKTQCLPAWAEETGINIRTLWSRINRGWSTEKTLTTPVRRKKK